MLYDFKTEHTSTSTSSFLHDLLMIMKISTANIFTLYYKMFNNGPEVHLIVISPTSPLVSSPKATQNLPQERGGGVQHLRFPALPRALLPRHLPLGDGQLHEELPLPVLRGLMRSRAHSGGPAPEGGRVPLHGHRGRRQDGGHLLPLGVQRGAPGRLAGLHPGLLPAAGGGRTLAAVTLAHANANPCLCLHRGLHGDRRNKRRAWPPSEVQVRFAEHGGTKRV